MRRPLIAGNWKLNGSRDSATALATEVAAASSEIDVDLLVCPSFTLLAPVQSALGSSCVALGAQNLSAHESGALTGEVSAQMVSEAGCRYVIIGHSERRGLFGEQDSDVAAKVQRALAQSLVPIVCVGESLDERDAGRELAVVSRQLDSALGALDSTALANCVVAYEPVWAIGTGRSASPEQAQAVHAAMREWLIGREAGAGNTVRLLYGGSVKPDNARALFAQRDIDGALIGGASLDAADFLAIARAAV